MRIENMDTTELFLCQCHNVSHQLILSTIDGTNPRTVYCSFHLDNYGLWNRIKSAILYLVGKDRKNGDFDGMLIKPEDSERLSLFLDYLEGKPSNTAFSEVGNLEQTYEEKNARHSWKVTCLFSYDMFSKEYIHHLVINKCECISEPKIGTDYEIRHSVAMKNALLPLRFVNAIKHIFGYRSCYGDFDSYELTIRDVPSLRKFVNILNAIKI